MPSTRIKVPGLTDGLLTWKRLPGYYIYPDSPFYVTNIPCNPDIPGSSAINESRSFDASWNFNLSKTLGAQAGAQFGPIDKAINASITANMGVTIGLSTMVSITETVFGELCRSVQYEFFERYIVWEVSLIPPNAPRVGRQNFKIWKPVDGALKKKAYIPPTCCTLTSSSIGQQLDEYAEELVSAQVGVIVRRAADEVISARGTLASSGLFSEALGDFSRALSSLQTAADLGANTAPFSKQILDIMDEVTRVEVMDLIDQSRLNLENSEIVSETLTQASEAYKLFGEARKLNADDPAGAAVCYDKACQIANSVMSHNIDSFGDMREIEREPVTGGFTESDIVGFSS